MINDEKMLTIAGYMDDEIREDLHSKMCPCTNEEFLAAYVERDPEFAELLEIEFDITL